MNTNLFDYMFTFFNSISAIITVTVPIIALIETITQLKKSKNKNTATFNVSLPKQKYRKKQTVRLYKRKFNLKSNMIIDMSKPATKGPLKSPPKSTDDASVKEFLLNIQSYSTSEMNANKKSDIPNDNIALNERND